MFHSVEQPNFIDSLATTNGYSYLLDMFGSPLLPLQEEHYHQPPPQMNIEADKHPEKCYDLISQMSNGALEKIPYQIEGHNKSFGGDVNMMTDSGSTRVPNDLKITAAVTTTTTKAIRPKKKGLPWTKLEHELFLEGMERYGRGDWKSIAQTYVLTRTPAQVASHAQKYFARLKRAEKTGVVRHPKAGVSMDTCSVAKPVVVNPTVVPPSGNGNVPTTFSNPASDFAKVPKTFTNPRSEESDNSISTLFFPSGDSPTVNRTNLFLPWKFSRVNPTIYVPPLDGSSSNEDVCIPSMDFITGPFSENTIIPPTSSVPPLENVCPYPDLNVNSSNKCPPSNYKPGDPNVCIPSLKNLCSDIITVLPNLPISPLDSSFTDHDVYRSLLDFLDAPPSNNVVVHPTIYAPPSNTKALDPTIPMPPNDFSSVHPRVSFPQQEYRTVSHIPSFTPCPSNTTYLPPYDDAYVEQMLIEHHFLNPSRGFIAFGRF